MIDPIVRVRLGFLDVDYELERRGVMPDRRMRRWCEWVFGELKAYRFIDTCVRDDRMAEKHRRQHGQTRLEIELLCFKKKLERPEVAVESMQALGLRPLNWWHELVSLGIQYPHLHNHPEVRPHLHEQDGRTGKETSIQICALDPIHRNNPNDTCTGIAYLGSDESGQVIVVPCMRDDSWWGFYWYAAAKI